MDDACRRFERSAPTVASPGVEIVATLTTKRPPGSFDPELRDLLERTAQARGYRTMRLHTIAGHDAVPLCAVCRSAMIFVPSVAGVSHREDELTHPADLEAGAAVLADALHALATP